MCELSLNNGITFMSVKDLYKVEKEIIFYWEELIMFMDNDVMEIVNDFTEADTDTDYGKIKYIIDYLNTSSIDIVLG